MRAHSHTWGAQQAPEIICAVFFDKQTMSLQRISEFAENQEGNAFFVTLRRGALSSLHPEVFA